MKNGALPVMNITGVSLFNGPRTSLPRTLPPEEGPMALIQIYTLPDYYRRHRLMLTAQDALSQGCSRFALPL